MSDTASNFTSSPTSNPITNETGIRGYRNALRGMSILFLAASLISGVLPGGIIGLGLVEVVILGLIYKLAEAIKQPAFAYFIPTALSAGACYYFISQANPNQILTAIGATAVALLVHTISILVLEVSTQKVLTRIKRKRAALNTKK